ncbi:MAG: type II CRISPR RNA-guided endonuclease Cas9 [Planctomycetota bacterium]|nr:MAG: type II CRISPR RNA-guided endonuclease Cas9 [Planctomycetota bacterium]REK34087.1 MAG: type II CRISPR RNA-guided endonuclease Cas9 [Planctomycetota bacterium]
MAGYSDYVLGLDLGASSLGWAMVELDPARKYKPVRIRDAGVRIFEAGVEGDIEQGKDSSRATQRREARLPRRQHWRRQHRKRKLFRVLQKHALLPQSESDSAADRKATLDALDAELAASHLPQGDHLAHQKLPYLLRAKAAEQRVEPYELGRALYHLAQRRGYLSNRKGADDEDDREGKVAGGISEIDQAKGDKTLGQFFAEDVDVFAHETKSDDDGRDPKTGRIRRRYTSRKMYQDEFSAIRNAQQDHHPGVDTDAWNEIERAIFFQRPLKSQKHLIGCCSLEPERRRCAEALPVYQEFRVLQQVNHLTLRLPGGTERPLNDDERTTLIDLLRRQGEMKFTKARKELNLPKGAEFTIEEWEERLVGHRTNKQMLSVFGERWFEFTPEQQDRITLDVLHYLKPEALVQRAMDEWGLNRQDARRLSKTRLEEGYASLSRRALEKLLAKMRDGTPYATARRELYPEQFAAEIALDALPPLYIWNRDLRNPAVQRALTEVRKVVNSLVAKYGKPARIHIELARELKASRDERKRRWKNATEQRKRREKAAAEILKEVGIERPSRRDIEKWLLREECGGICPYSGKSINGRALLGSHPEFDIEHIYPRKYLDDSFRNKTLCHVSVNRDRKRNLLPSQAFSGAEYEKILQRVKAFSGPFAAEKLKRFEAEDVPEDFVSRDLNDTRYNSRLAADYVAVLYGGRVDSDNITRVYAPTGGLTWMLRNGWQLNGILSTENEKTRDDNRHHAVDALIVALTDAARIKALQEAAEDAAKQESRAFVRAMKLPWNNLLDEARKVIHGINVSHRPTRTISGPLHAESIYSKPHVTADGKTEHRIRKELHKLNEKEINGEQIVDPSVRRAVQQKYAALKAENPRAKPAQFWSNKDDVEKFPALPSKSGSSTPIFKVRLKVDAKPRPVGKGVRQRNIASGKDSNFASMVYAVLDKNGNEKKWVHEIITRLEAHERLSANKNRAGEKVLIPDEQDGKRRFKFALVKNDMLLLEGPDRQHELYRVLSFSDSEIQLCEHNRARLEKRDRTKWTRITSTDALRKRNARKVDVTVVGDIG